MRGTLTVYKDATGFYAQWRDDDQKGLVAPGPGEAEVVFAVSGEWESPELREEAITKAREHGVPERKVSEAFPK